MPDNATPLILLTRPMAQATRFAQICKAEFGARAELLLAPMQEIVFAGTLPDLPPDAIRIFTSESGVRAYLAAGGKPGGRAYCVGGRTAAVAREAGFDARAAQGTVGSLADLITRTHDAGPLVHLHGLHKAGDLVTSLANAGFSVTGHAIYDQRALPLTAQAQAALASPRRVIAPLFSPRSAALLAAAAPDCVNTTLPCISRAARDALPEALRERAAISDAPSGEAMLIAIARQLCP